MNKIEIDKDINGKPLLEHLVNSQNFRPFILTCVQTRKEVIDILKRTNNTRKSKKRQKRKRNNKFIKFQETPSICIRRYLYVRI